MCLCICGCVYNADRGGGLEQVRKECMHRERQRFSCQTKSFSGLPPEFFTRDGSYSIFSLHLRPGPQLSRGVQSGRIFLLLLFNLLVTRLAILSVFLLCHNYHVFQLNLMYHRRLHPHVSHTKVVDVSMYWLQTLCFLHVGYNPLLIYQYKPSRH